LQRSFFKRPKFIPLTYLTHPAGVPVSRARNTVGDKSGPVHRGRERGAAVLGMGGGGARAGAGRTGTCKP